MSILVLQFDTTLLSWLDFSFSDYHYMVMFTTLSESTVTGTRSSYLNVTNRRSLSKCTDQYKNKDVSKIPVKLRTVILACTK